MYYMEEERKPLESRNFIDAFIEEDIAPGGQFEGLKVHTRFPPEPNGYLHIGHCKALTIDFGTAEKFGGLCNLRMDDTNPTKEDTEYVDAIQADIHWLGFDWGDRFFYGSDYFEKDYEYAVELIKKGLAYVCDLTAEQFREYRGDIGKPAVSPYRDRSVEENLDLFARMRAGEFPEGSKTLRAKIDLASGNFNMRDPVIYRIRYMHHHRQGDKWCIYPMYDFAHPIQDALEGITHSLCSLEFEAHRPLYDWVVSNISIPYHKPRQIEFARLGIDHTVMSKRKLRLLVETGRVSGWDDPRMPTLCVDAATRAIPSAISASASAWQNPRTRWSMRCLSTACAKISTTPPSARWPSFAL
jgi:glutaminyl-tRNA synthetase